MQSDENSTETRTGSLTANKELVSEFIQSFYNEKDLDRAKSMLAENFANHHPGVGVGRDRTVNGFRTHVAEPFPEFSLIIQRMVAEGDYVWTHGLVKLAPDAPDVVVVDIWRIHDGMLAEHWDVGQSVPEDSTVDEMLSDS
ncbi:MAG: nuclear transport factor 2 family protein [Pseudonocardiaceae bacterium]